ncbi:hypothetical protein [Bacillus sp. XF8]|uniref:hypothetical protein n=1 Tax=Bacillus sp. XF8 TaxID=2819289 RepID=UPI001AA07950|nr:hypothetical protein [Bacillus sp. XF8]MBO1579356.1 hypothetical protein [Bacillus sp. XF8]
MTTNTIEVTNLDKAMQSIDELVEKFQNALTAITGVETEVNTFSIGSAYLVYLRSGHASKTLLFDLSEVK